MNYYMNSLNNSYLAVHTDALCANVAAIEKTLSPGAEIIPVLKCDAYGLSLSLTAPALAALPGHPHIRARACVRGFGAARARH